MNIHDAFCVVNINEALPKFGMRTLFLEMVAIVKHRLDKLLASGNRHEKAEASIDQYVARAKFTIGRDDRQPKSQRLTYCQRPPFPA